MEEIVAYCGLLCSDCPAYLGTQADDLAALEQVVARWREEFNAPNLTVASIRCDGCLGAGGRKMSHCFECEMRACAMGRGVLNCAHCPEHACETLQGFLGFVPDARTRLDGMRTGLMA
jgi:hypothetical protein